MNTHGGLRNATVVAMGVLLIFGLAAAPQAQQAALNIVIDTASPQVGEEVAGRVTIQGTDFTPDFEYKGYVVILQADPASGLDAAATAGGDFGMDAFVGTDTSSAVNGLIGRALINTTTNQQLATAETTLMNFTFTPNVLPLCLTYLISGQTGIMTNQGLPDDTLELDDPKVTLNDPVCAEGGGETPTDTPTVIVTPTDTPTETVPPTDTPTEIIPPTDTPTEIVEMTPTPTETGFDTPTPTPTEATPTPTPTEAGPTDTPTEVEPAIGLIAVDGFGGVHTAPDAVSLNTACFDYYVHPFHVLRDANLMANESGFFTVDGLGHVYSWTLGETCVDQIPNDQQFYFPPQDIVVAVRAIGTATDSAVVLVDNGALLPYGNAPDLDDVDPELPYRDGTDDEFDQDGDRSMVIPGPREGPGPKGTIADTGGWDPQSAIDFDLWGADGAIVLARSGEVFPIGTAQVLARTPFFGVDIARRIEHFTAGGEDYSVTLDGLGGVHLAGPDGGLRDNWNANVLTELNYFGAVVGQDNGHDVYAGIDAANDFVVILLDGETDIGIIMLDGWGGLHDANLGPAYTMVKTAYLPNVDQNFHAMISLMMLGLQ